MANVAIIEAKPSKNNYEQLFNHEFEFDRYALCSDPSIKKVLKKDIDIEIDIDKYKYVILVGSEPLKVYTKLNSITSYTGQVVEEKFLPVINPAMISFKPEAQRPWEESRDKIVLRVRGELQETEIDYSKFLGIEDTEEAKAYIKAALEYPQEWIALDSETSALYPRDGYVLGISLTYKQDTGAYISSECIDEEVENLCQELFYEKTVVFHNAKFDMGFLEYHFNWEFPVFEDTMLMHYTLDETQGTHGLKQLAIKFTEYGDYEKDLEDWRSDYCKKNKIKKEDFSYDLFPFEVIYPYAAIDTCTTDLLYRKFLPYLKKNNKLMGVYRNILLPGTRFLTDIQDNGVPFDAERLKFAKMVKEEEIQKAVEGLSEFKEIAEFEEKEGKCFNPNSTVQLRKLLFDYVGLRPTGKRTGTGAHSTDAEVLGQLAEVHPIPKYILELRKSSKIKNTYIDKIIPQLDKDGRLRTGFSLHTTTSGRLSSSGKLNMQQIPRDDPTIKGCIRAKPGYKIVAMDLTTAEMYYAAVLSGDLALQEVFKSGGNIHSATAKQVFNLDCAVEEVEKYYKEKRQGTKAINFGVLYGAGANKIAESAGISVEEAQEVIETYFGTFWQLKKWLTETQNFIKQNAYVYSPLGRKRRLPNAKSTDRSVSGHEIRSGVNSIIQSVSSDINLLGAVETHEWIKKNNLDIKIFALVHDSVLAEVREDLVDVYSEKLKEFIQKDRGVSIPGTPVGCDFDVADDYSLGKFEKFYEDRL